MMLPLGEAPLNLNVSEWFSGEGVYWYFSPPDGDAFRSKPSGEAWLTPRGKWAKPEWG